jgi:hypothetical protein
MKAFRASAIALFTCGFFIARARCGFREIHGYRAYGDTSRPGHDFSGSKTERDDAASGQDASAAVSEHDPEKCVAVFRKDHAQSKA